MHDPIKLDITIFLFIKRTGWAIIILFIILVLNSYASQDSNHSPIQVDARVDTAAVTVGDVLNFTVVITADPDIQPEPVDFNTYFKGFDVIQNGVKKPKKRDQQIRTEVWYRLRADEVGEYTIPPVPITFTAPDPKFPQNNVQGQILTPEVKIEILSVLSLQDNPQDIRDIKPIIEMAPDWQRYILYGLLVVSALAALFIWIYNNEVPNEPKIAKVPSLLAHERAIQELHNLKTKNLLSRRMFREHYFELSEIFRRYLGIRFDAPALDWTSPEIKSWLKSKRILIDSLRIEVETILDRTDQVKFAKLEPSSLVSDEIMSSVFQLINATKEVPKPLELQNQIPL